MGDEQGIEKEGGCFLNELCKPMRGVAVRDRIRNEDIWTGCDSMHKLSERMDWAVLDGEHELREAGEANL